MYVENLYTVSTFYICGMSPIRGLLMAREYLSLRITSPQYKPHNPIRSDRLGISTDRHRTPLAVSDPLSEAGYLSRVYRALLGR
jgi:hypothetical protein